MKLRRKLRAWRRALGLWIAGESKRPIGITDSAHHHFCDSARTVRTITVDVQSLDPTTAAAMLHGRRDEIAALVARGCAR